MHLAEHLALPAPYRARAYDGPADHGAMQRVLAAAREHAGISEMPTVAEMDVTYANLRDCDPTTDIALVEHPDAGVVAYSRTSFEDLGTGTRDLIVFTPTLPSHVAAPLFDALVSGSEAHLLLHATGDSRYRAYASHPGPGREAEGESAWLEAAGYTATEWGAALVRPHLDDIPARPLPDGVEVRAVTESQVRQVLEAHWEAFRGEWDFREPTESDYAETEAHPDLDISLWRVAWSGDTVVGQVKTYISPLENAERGYLRGYTEEISTHRDWRNRGVAGALLAMSLEALRERGMTEAALGVDTNNPGGAFQLYTSLGFELRSYEAVYTKAAGSAGGVA
ncbi:MAG: GNAT family N-acetyltransferase [Ilumatobacteraceae bacterium]